jgi:hypothetical protein
VIVVVREVLGEDMLETTPTEDENSVEALPADAAHEPLGDRVRSRGPDRRPDDPDALGAEHVVEAGGELRVPIAENLTSRERSARCKLRLRACWVTLKGSSAGSVV